MTKILQQNLNIINQNLDLIKTDYNVKKIGIFGSIASNNQTKNSDIDILIEFSKPVGFFKFIELEDLLSKKLKRKVDLVTKKALKTAVKKDILKKVIYA